VFTVPYVIFKNNRLTSICCWAEVIHIIITNIITAANYIERNVATIINIIQGPANIETTAINIINNYIRAVLISI